MEWIRTLAGQAGERFLPVKDLIDQAAADPEWADHVSVLALTCGTGKSSAISLKIAETIHAIKEEGSDAGLLIVSDRKEALKRYLSPDHMPNVKRYLQQSSDMISRMDDDTIKEEKDRFYQCPVLLMTYARYFGNDRSGIKNRYLRWGNGSRRTCIIMDEEPPILDTMKIGNTEIARVDAAIRNGLVTFDQAERAWCLETWERVRNKLHDILEGNSIQLYKDKAEELFLYMPEEELMPKEDLDRFIRDTYQHSILAEDMDAPVLLDEMLRITFNGAYGSAWRRPGGNLSMAFYAVRNNGNLMTGLDSKVIVLDGTADISTAYQHEYIHMVSCDSIRMRQFPELTIKLVNLNTSRSAFTANQEEIIKTVREYLLAHGEALENVTIFTYKKRPESGFRRERIYYTVEHLGNIRGRNDLKDSHRIAQAGVFNKPPLTYTLEYFELNEEAAHGEECLSTAVREYPAENIHDFLHMMNTEAKAPDDLKIREAATDFEQNVFRTALRNPENTEPVTYYLFADTHMFSRLVGFIQDRFEGKYGSRVEEPDSVETMVRKIRAKSSAAHRLIDWLSTRQARKVFAKATMLTEVGLTENQFASVKKDHALIAEWFKQMYEALPPDTPRKGFYMMTEDILEKLK